MQGQTNICIIELLRFLCMKKGNRIFEHLELKMLVDAAASSKVISSQKTETLIQKFCRLASTY